MEHLEGNRSVLIVCDGVSSSTHPENASATAATIVAAVIQTDSRAHTIATIGWLGDSRAYWISPENARLLTRDDS